VAIYYHSQCAQIEDRRSTTNEVDCVFDAFPTHHIKTVADTGDIRGATEILIGKSGRKET
jgi:hypothetical protein